MNKHLKNILHKPLWLSTIALAISLLAGGVIFWLGQPTNLVKTAVTVKTGQINQIIRATGQVKALSGADLSFDRTGKIAQIKVKTGDTVSDGQTLISLDNSDIIAQLHQAQANVDIQTAKLAQMKSPRPEDLEIQNLKVSGANDSLTEAKQNAIDKIEDAFIKADDAIHNQIDNLFNNPKTATPKYLVNYSDSQLLINIENNRPLIENNFTAWHNTINSISTTDNLSDKISEVTNYLNKIKYFLDDISITVNGIQPNTSLSQTTITGWRTAVSVSRTNISSALSALTAAKEKLVAADSVYKQAQTQLDITQDGARIEDIKAQEAQLALTKAGVEAAQSLLNKTVIRAPFAGIVSKLDAIIGQSVIVNNPMVSVISPNQFKIIAYIPESNIPFIKINDMASTTLDAYGNKENFDAKIISIETSPTTIDGSSVYKTELLITNKTEKVNTGLTVNVTILIKSKENTLIVPRKAILQKNNGYFVMINKGNNQTEERAVQIGLQDQNGNTEIISGLNENDIIYSY